MGAVGKRLRACICAMRPGGGGRGVLGIQQSPIDPHRPVISAAAGEFRLHHVPATKIPSQYAFTDIKHDSLLKAWLRHSRRKGRAR